MKYTPMLKILSFALAGSLGAITIGATTISSAFPGAEMIGLSPSALAQSRLAQNAQRSQAVQMQLSAQKQVITKDAQGKPQTTWQSMNPAAASVQPGDVLRYTLTSKNQSNQPVKNLVLTQPVPKGTVFVLNSVTAAAAQDTVVLYSIDQGKTFVPQPTIQVRDANGQMVTRPAPAEAYTHVRWQVRQALPPAATLQNSYQVKVR
jgi:uncharacterized repeat protein (TIGR01451 family)